MMSDSETVNLILLWGQIAPFEPNAYDWRCKWQVWEVEHGFLPVDFLKPDADEDEDWEYLEWIKDLNRQYDERNN